jgi:Alkylmercury lyase
MPRIGRLGRMKMDDQNALGRLHFELINGLVEDAACPTTSELAYRMRAAPVKVEEHLHALSAIHGVVLHPCECRPWVIHPFSLTPTIHWIEGQRAGWWAPCVWCALGVAALVGGEVRVHTRYGAESEPLTIPVTDGKPVGFENVCIHFAIRPAGAWNNVHEHCSMVLPFRSADEIPEWCNRHRLPRGEAVPLHQVAHLAKLWYGSHANPDWHKWSVAEAQDIFHRAGLRSAFWDLGSKPGQF